ncbi:MAG: hypothetical protein E7091_02950 [Bacteroidales bacterium]|nr:hypothetical protein [Bacteroidales bacterium]
MTELIIGIGVFAALIIFYWCFKRDDTPQNTIKEQTPGDIFRALGAVLHGDEEDEDGSRHTYLVEYQGGIFMFVFHKDSPWVFLRFYEFKECGYEHLHKALEAANSINTTQGAWNCGISKKESDTDGTPILTANLEYLFSCVGNLEQMKGELQVLLGGAFSLARDFSDELDKAIKEDEEKDEMFFNDCAFNNKLATISRQMEAHHTDEETEDEDTPFFLSVHQLVQLYENVDFGCLLSLKIVQGNSVEHITDISTITAFDVREYIRQHAEPTSLNSIVLIYEFEHQTLFVNLTKAKGSTDNTLYYIVNVVRSGDELDQFMGNRTSLSSRTMLEVRLSGEDKAAWEAKYMIDDAMDKVANDKEDELTDEQRLVVAHHQPNAQTDLYWGKKYFNHRCYYQALFHFNRVFRVILTRPYKDWKEGVKELFYDICYYIGFIYADLGMNVRACYYLNIARESNRIDYIEEFVNCICNMRDPSTLGMVVSYINDIREKMDANESEIERLMPMFQFFQRRYLYLLVEYKKWDEAEKQANFMLKNDIDVEFAKDELEYVRKMREEDKKNEN